ncbi:MAG: GNAT family N-acetyltransferase [Usitatibacter sp.]
MPDFSNLIWQSLSGTQAPLTLGNANARRFAPSYPPMFGFADPANPDIEVLREHCTAGDVLWCSEWRGPVTEGWTVEIEGSMFAMVWQAPEPHVDEDMPVRRLGPAHVDEMVALAALAKPGPFASQPMAMGEWHGIVEDGQLVAMAGERLQAGALREVSGVCTLPSHRGRGYARCLMETVVRSQLRRGLTPFLHVSATNVQAIELYSRMGFVKVHEAAMRVVRFDG